MCYKSKAVFRVNLLSRGNMKSFQLVSLSVVVGAMVLAGCSGGGRARVAGRQCAANYKPFDMAALKPEQKLWKKGDNESVIPAGTYSFERADLVYTAKGDKGLVVHVQEVRARDGSFKPQVLCVRNSRKLDEAPVNVSTPLVSKIVSKANLAAEVEAKELLFKVVEGRLVAESKNLEKSDSVEKVYSGKAEDLVMIESANKVDYEIRSVYSDNNADYVVSVKFKKAP